MSPRPERAVLQPRPRSNECARLTSVSIVGRAGMPCNSRAHPSGERQRAARCRRRLSAGRKLDASLWKDVIAGLPPGYGAWHRPCRRARTGGS